MNAGLRTVACHLLGEFRGIPSHDTRHRFPHGFARTGNLPPSALLASVVIPAWFHRTAVFPGWAVCLSSSPHIARSHHRCEIGDRSPPSFIRKLDVSRDFLIACQCFLKCYLAVFSASLHREDFARIQILCSFDFSES
jgi:hypothetical protein